MKNPFGNLLYSRNFYIGYLLGGEKYLTYGMVGGLLVGYLLDEETGQRQKKIDFRDPYTNQSMFP
jgi:hypothetical protein